MRNYDVQYRGQYTHRNITASELAALILEGQVAGLDSYAPTDRRDWRPICQLTPVRNKSGEWEVREQSQLRRVRPSETPIRHTPPSIQGGQTGSSNATPPPPPVGIYINSGPPGTGQGTDGQVQHGGSLSAKLAVAGFSLCALSIMASIGFILLDDAYDDAVAITGMMLALFGVLLSVFGVQYAQRRALPIIGVIFGMLELVAWALYFGLNAPSPS